MSWRSVLWRINRNINDYPEKIAIKSEDTSITYKELGNIISQIRKRLLESNIGAEDIVAIYMERSWIWACAMLGVLFSKAAFLPIDKKSPTEWVSYALDKSETKIVLTDSSDIHIDHFEGEVINIRTLLEKPVVVDEKLEFEEVDFNSLAYVIFTSGTTGNPKGVQIEHGSMLNHLESKITLLQLSEESCMAHNASIGFDISVWQVLTPLVVGGKLIVITEQEVKSIRKFVSVIVKEEVSILEVVPAHLNAICFYCKTKELSLPKLKYILSTGEALKKEVTKKWFRLFEIPIVNAYGPTEASDDVLHKVIYKEDINEDISIGKPIQNAILSICNSDGKPCDLG